MRFVIITGISGAGKSYTMKYLEDLGYFCVDNLPPALIPKFAEICSQSASTLKQIAMVIDIRGGELLKEFFPNVNHLKKIGIPYEILFLDATDEVLIKRFKESRRLHPISKGRRIMTGLMEERKILKNIKDSSHYILDTSNLSIKQLKEEIQKIFQENKNPPKFVINMISFGFKYGVPQDADLVFDVRFIPNPFYIESMKRLTGKDRSVSEYVIDNDITKAFMDKVMDLMKFLIPNYITEGKSQLVIAIGCTGGRHRSVAITEALEVHLKKENHPIWIEHRDIEKDQRHV